MRRLIAWNSHPDIQKFKPQALKLGKAYVRKKGVSGLND